jgi:Uma2 family endonuclease
MASGTPVSVAEYLRTRYRPDVDYVDGELQQRNVGEKTHSKLERLLVEWFEKKGLFAIHETRVQVAATRFRIPDVCVYADGEPEEEVFTRPPLLCIEILSPEDRVHRMQERIDDYLRFGVAQVWVIDPQTRRGWIYTAEGMREAKDGVMRTVAPPIELPLPELFS